jgi:quercetin dioxygenase-like cupin family protein
LSEELQPPLSGKQSKVLLDEERTKVILIAFAAGAGLAEHVTPLPATIQIISGKASMTVGDEVVAGRAGTWIETAAKTPHSIEASAPLIMLLTLRK